MLSTAVLGYCYITEKEPLMEKGKFTCFKAKEGADKLLTPRNES
jgi:hypothetical protein